MRRRGIATLIFIVLALPAVSHASLTPAQVARINTDLAAMKSLGFKNVRFLTFTNPKDPLYASWAKDVFLSFPTPTPQELANVKQFFQLVDNAGMTHSVVLLMPESHNEYYVCGATSADYRKFVDAIWTVIWTGKLRHLYVGGDIMLDANSLDAVHPDTQHLGGINVINSHRRWIQDMWSYINTKYPGGNYGIELSLFYMPLSARWIRANLRPQPTYLGFQYYPTRAALQALGFESGGVVNWAAATQDFLQGIKQAAGPIPVVVDEIGLNLAPTVTGWSPPPPPPSPPCTVSTYMGTPTMGPPEFTAQDQRDFLTQALPILNASGVPFNVWEFADNAGIGLFGLKTESGVWRPAASAIIPAVTAARDANLYPGIQYQPLGSVGLQFIMPVPPATLTLKVCNPFGGSTCVTNDQSITVPYNTNIGVSWTSANIKNGTCSYTGPSGTTLTSLSNSNPAPGWGGYITVSRDIKLTCTDLGGNQKSAVVHVTVQVPTSTIQGKRVLMPGNVVDTVAQTVWVAGGSPKSDANPYSLTVNAGATYTVNVATRAGYTIGYTRCIDSASCHSQTPTPGTSATVTITAGTGHYADLWWHYTPLVAPPSPTNLSASCPAPAWGSATTYATMSWSPSPGATGYNVRVNVGAASCPAGWSTNINPIGAHICYVDNYNGLSCGGTDSLRKSCLPLPVGTYNTWVHAVNAGGGSTLTSTNFTCAAPVTGFVGGVTPTNNVNGWACQKKNPASINVHLYVGGPAGGGGILIGSYLANKASETAVATACESTGTAYRYSIPLSTATMQQHAGKLIYVYGISPVTGGTNVLLTKSGTYKVPTPLAAPSPITISASPNPCTAIGTSTKCTTILHRTVPSSVTTRLFYSAGGNDPVAIGCVKGSLDKSIPWIVVGRVYTFNLYKTTTCTDSITGKMPDATVVVRGIK